MNTLTPATKRQTGIDTLTDTLQNWIANDSEIKNAILQNPEYVNRILQTIAIDEIKAGLHKQKTALAYDWEKETGDFLTNAGFQSGNTKKAYLYALQDFKRYTDTKGLETPFLCDPATADNWINAQRLDGKANATIRRNIGALSSFFGFMERRTNYEVKNIFRGTRARPPRKDKKRIENEIPTTNLKLFRKDIMQIINAETCNELKAMIYIMAFRGLRAGSFQNMNVHGNRFFTSSKGKEINGVLPETCIKALQDLGIKHNEPFKDWNTAKVSSTFQYHIARLYEQGKISYKYSCHDLRHFYALTEYTKTKDIYNVSKLLGHSSIAITETYLRGLKVIE